MIGDIQNATRENRQKPFTSKKTSKKGAKVWKYFAPKMTDTRMPWIITLVFWLTNLRPQWTSSEPCLEISQPTTSIDKSSIVWPNGPVSVIRFTSEFEMSWGNIFIHETAAKCLVPHFMKRMAEATMTAWLSLRPKSPEKKTLEGVLLKQSPY